MKFTRRNPRFDDSMLRRPDINTNLLINLMWLVAVVMSTESIAAGPSELLFEPVNVSVSSSRVDNHAVIRVTKDPAVKEFDEATFAKLKGASFENGTIEVKVLSRLLPDAPEYARGFIGLAFRISEDNSKFECIYVRPANSRSEDQVRRNHSIQYFAYPDFKFQRLRKESPESYESYADIGLNEWIDLKIVVKGSQAKLFVNGQEQPSLIVNDLKLGPAGSGSVGLFVDVGTEGFFRDLKIQRD